MFASDNGMIPALIVLLRRGLANTHLMADVIIKYNHFFYSYILSFVFSSYIIALYVWINLIGRTHCYWYGSDTRYSKHNWKWIGSLLLITYYHSFHLLSTVCSLIISIVLCVGLSYASLIIRRLQISKSISTFEAYSIWYMVGINSICLW